jgi:hypothetical protein
MRTVIWDILKSTVRAEFTNAPLLKVPPLREGNRAGGRFHTPREGNRAGGRLYTLREGNQAWHGFGSPASRGNLQEGVGYRPCLLRSSPRRLA